jgi:hypothetical protein
MATKYHLYIEAIFNSERTIPCSIFCDLDSEKPTTGLIPGDRIFCKDTGKFYKAISSTNLVEIGGGGGSPYWGNILGAITDQTDLIAEFDEKANATHAHIETDVTNLVNDLAGKEAANANIQTHITSPHAPSNAQKNSDITTQEIQAKLTGEINTHTHPGGGGGLSHGQVMSRIFIGG